MLAHVGYVDRSMLPWDLPNLMLNKGMHQVRTLGRTAAGDPDAYAEVVLSEEEKAHYFRHGYVVLHNVVPPSILDVVRQALLDEVGLASHPWGHSSYQAVDAVLDFYVFSNIASIAAQLFGSPESDVRGERLEGGRASTYLWSDFHWFRPARGPQVTRSHFDEMECEGLVPANYTTKSRLRMWLTLDDDVPAPPLINQSHMVASMGESQRAAYFRGELKGNHTMFTMMAGETGKRFGDMKDPKVWTRLPTMSRGDVLVHSPCLIHTSPHAVGRHVGCLCVTFAPGQARHFRSKNAGAPGMSCDRKIPLHDRIEGHKDPCVPQVYPRDPDFKPGATLRMHRPHLKAREVLGTWWHWRMVLARRCMKLGGWPEPNFSYIIPDSSRSEL